MKKASIEQFINRYNLGGEVESVKIESNDSDIDKFDKLCDHIIIKDKESKNWETNSQLLLLPKISCKIGILALSTIGAHRNFRL